MASGCHGTSKGWKATGCFHHLSHLERGQKPVLLHGAEDQRLQLAVLSIVANVLWYTPQLAVNKIMTGNITQCHDKIKHEAEINGNIKIFTEVEIERITRNFSTLIGKGGFGEVYMGILDDDNEPVAVKKYINEDLREVFMEEGCLTPRSDVYSFGLVLCELIARERVRKGDINLIGYVNKGCASGKGFREIFDAAIANENNMKILKEMKKLAIECLSLISYRRPQMTDVVKRLRILRKELKDRHENYSESILASHHSWRRNNRQEIIMPTYNSKMQIKKSLVFLKRNLSNSKIQSEPSNVRILTQEELKEVTHNYSYLLSGGTSGRVYKGTLEDNTVVAVRIFSQVLEGFEEAFINGGMILSQIFHRNIIKLLGYCPDADCPAFMYEFAAKGSLSDVLDRHEDFPLDLRAKIAVKIAEALEYLHSSATGIIRHGYVVPSKILLDDNFMPKLTGFSWARKFIKESNIIASDDAITSHQLPSSRFYDDLIHDHCVSLKVKTDVYQFGVLLLTLISRKNFVFYADHDDLISQFRTACLADGSGRTFFDDDIAVHGGDIVLLEEMGRLSLKCICEEIDRRPTMKEVAEHLRIITRSWKKCSSDGATPVSKTVTKSHITGAEGTKLDRPLSSDIRDWP
ncbi:unnamed protein product [Miscanthus lutarioriparius]|uniref:Protein kinase domain-containing protein n=1 Tax=Miscanthus lutarioriparius TaxID=422564 RepID=A0A811QBP6_9POAL|nr:unnamed protein product [Miscanthus lutarioriparius]